MYITNAFSLQMVSGNCIAEISEITRRFAAKYAGCGVTSAIGHADTASVVSAELRLNLPANRVNISLKAGDELLVAQLTGGRLPEGSTTLPEGFSISYKLVRIKELTPPPAPIRVDLPHQGTYAQWLIFTPSGAEYYTQSTGGRDYQPQLKKIIPLAEVAAFLADNQEVEVKPLKRKPIVEIDDMGNIDEY